ncbi:hypothetical protein P8C59_006633 [Phyllachora maydis]|uniref:Uncharacterized protein n=1 Tax=Phyllachora maydis TaxID=1825666 RepID=A0AAD9I8L2_9PEZI|nr:hypothetical protein P8C59_006633 [Phyllachora maydis]
MAKRKNFGTRRLRDHGPRVVTAAAVQEADPHRPGSGGGSSSSSSNSDADAVPSRREDRRRRTTAVVQAQRNQGRQAAGGAVMPPRSPRANHANRRAARHANEGSRRYHFRSLSLPADGRHQHHDPSVRTTSTNHHHYHNNDNNEISPHPPPRAQHGRPPHRPPPPCPASADHPPCHGCDVVRASNERLRAALASASAALDRWADDVGVGDGRTVERMEWQREPTTTVVFAPSPSSAASSSPAAADHRFSATVADLVRGRVISPETRQPAGDGAVPGGGGKHWS